MNWSGQVFTLRRIRLMSCERRHLRELDDIYDGERGGSVPLRDWLPRNRSEFQRGQGTLSTVRALLAQPRERDELRYHSFVFPEHKVLYHETPKAACSAIKVGLLSLTGRTLADLGMSKYPRKFPGGRRPRPWCVPGPVTGRARRCDPCRRRGREGMDTVLCRQGSVLSTLLGVGGQDLPGGSGAR